MVRERDGQRSEAFTATLFRRSAASWRL